MATLEITDLEAALSQSIAWAEMTFPDETIREQGVHLVKELQEIDDALLRDAPMRELEAEVADGIMLACLISQRLLDAATRMKMDVPAAIIAKLEKNRDRVWARTETGDYQHVRCIECGTSISKAAGGCPKGCVTP